MSSVGSVIAQRPYRAKNLTVLNAGCYGFTTAAVEAAAPTGATQVVGSVITFGTLANATSTSGILTGAETLSGGSFTPTGGAALTIAAGQELLDLGRYVTVYLNSQKIYTLALVQLKRNATGVTEGVDGAAVGAEGYNAFYVAIETNLIAGNAPGSSGVGLVGVARV